MPEHADSERYLSENEERLLLRIARDALEAYVVRSEFLDVEPYPLTKTLREKHGAFVTLRHGKELRGCVGYTENIEPLARTVALNAVNAGARDSRFPPVTEPELPDITIEVSALTPGDTPDRPFKEVHDVRTIRIGRDGLYIQRPADRGGLLLPQVAVEQGWGLDEFLTGLCRKAGYPDTAWRDPDVRLYRFSAQVFSERTAL